MKLITSITILACYFLLLSCTSVEKAPTPEQIELESKRANDFFEKSFNQLLDRTPSWQSYLGIKTDYDKWDDISQENALKEIEIAKEQLQYLLDSINPKLLDKQTGISYRLFKENMENQIADYKWRLHDYPVNQMFGVHSGTPAFLINIHQVSDSSDAVAYIERLKGIKPYFKQLIDGLKLREDNGIVPPKFVFPRVIDDSKNVISGKPFEGEGTNALLEDFTRKVNGIELMDETKEALIAEAEAALMNSVKPAYDELITFLINQEKRATTDDGVWKMPEGDAFYANALKRTTTTDMTAEEIHEIGLKEVARIHDEMRAIMKQVEFEGTLQEFFVFMRDDEQFYYPDTEEGKKAYLDSAVVIIDDMKKELDSLFITKPKADIIVKRVEAFREKSAGTAFYQSPAPDGSRPGTYYANLYDMTNMPKYEMEALAYHEGIPGHHMERTISQELQGIPEFRKYGGYTAYVEGWGLYCELVPKEIGKYSNPYSDFGRLAMELWRACRLVVDTGIHLKKWTREEGIKYYQENTSASEKQCIKMVERHIVMASQATAYKVGMLKILELRAKAKEQMGSKFDIREFHDVVLTSGAVPLNILESLVDDYISSK